jgi:hypothetical protein
MVSFRSPTTLVRVSLANLDLATAIAKSTQRFREVRPQVGTAKKYVSYDARNDTYLMMISQRAHSPRGNQTILTITSYEDKRNTALAEQFQRETGLKYEANTPPELGIMTDGLNRLFPLFLANPDRFLTGWGVR